MDKNNLKLLFEYYQTLAEKSMDQLNDEQFFWKYNGISNSIAVLVQHLSGNMLSRFTNFLTEDGEKPWRNRDAEFELPIADRPKLMQLWNEGWACLYNALEEIKEEDWQKQILIRNQPQSVESAFLRQLAHYSYHVGQIVYVGKMLLAENWKSLSIPLKASLDYNNIKFNQPQKDYHFTDDFKRGSKL